MSCLCHVQQALLRIVKHCEDSLPAPSTGALLGLEIPRGEGQGSVLQVTYAFALPRGGRDAYGDRDGDDGDDEDRGDRERSYHQREMMKHLKEVRLGGWWMRREELWRIGRDELKIDACIVRDNVCGKTPWRTDPNPATRSSAYSLLI